MNDILDETLDDVSFVILIFTLFRIRYSLFMDLESLPLHKIQVRLVKSENLDKFCMKIYYNCNLILHGKCRFMLPPPPFNARYGIKDLKIFGAGLQD
jgi:hypothetical protein